MTKPTNRRIFRCIMERETDIRSEIYHLASLLLAGSRVPDPVFEYTTFVLGMRRFPGPNDNVLCIMTPREYPEFELFVVKKGIGKYHLAGRVGGMRVAEACEIMNNVLRKLVREMRN